MSRPHEILTFQQRIYSSPLLSTGKIFIRTSSPVYHRHCEYV